MSTYYYELCSHFHSLVKKTNHFFKLLNNGQFSMINDNVSLRNFCHILKTAAALSISEQLEIEIKMKKSTHNNNNDNDSNDNNEFYSELAQFISVRTKHYQLIQAFLFHSISLNNKIGEPFPMPSLYKIRIRENRANNVRACERVSGVVGCKFKFQTQLRVKILQMHINK